MWAVSDVDGMLRSDEVNPRKKQVRMNCEYQRFSRNDNSNDRLGICSKK